MSATTRYDRDMMRKIEPFNLLNNKAYKPQYVAGFLSERYSVGLQDGWNQAKMKFMITSMRRLRPKFVGKIVQM